MPLNELRNYRGVNPKPTDFDQYWDSALLEMNRVTPNLTITKKTHKSATNYTTKSGEKFNCNQFKNLTYDRMEKFIKALPKSEGYLRE